MTKTKRRKKSLVGYAERANLDNIKSIYSDWGRVNGVTFVSKSKKIWYEPVKVRLTIEEFK
jgi:hypothetical protein